MRILRALFRRKRWLIALVAVIVLGSGAGAWAISRSGNKPAANSTTLVAATTATMRQTVTASGTLAPAVESDLSFTVAGTVSSVPVAVGASVAKGAVLATVGTTDLQAAVGSAQANLDAANAALTAAAGSTAAQLASAQAQVTSATSKLADAKTALAAATLRSPIAGTVATVSIASGDQVSGNGSSANTGGSGSSGNTGANGANSGSSSTSSSSSSNSAQIVVISTTSWIVNASVGSADLGQLKKGLQAEITPTDASAAVFGTVSSIGIVASTSSGGSATFPVKIAVTGSPTGLYAGGTANVTIIVKQLQNVLTVPTPAVHTVNGKTVVYQRRNGKQVDTPVTVGSVFGASTQISAGLKDGDQVVVTSFGPAGGGTNRQRGGGGAGGFGGGGAGGGGGGAGGGGFAVPSSTGGK